MHDRTELYSYQLKAAEFIRTHENCALWVDVGLGKTVSTLTAFADLAASFDARRALVVAPLRVARKVWSDEIAQWSHLKGMTCARIVGTPEERMAALRTPADIHTINVEQIPWLEAQFIQNNKQIVRWPWDTTVLDESQLFMDQGSVRFKKMRRLRKLIPRMVQLTGTPAPKGYQALWSQAFLLDGGARLGGTEQAFLDRWFTTTRYDTHTATTLRDNSAGEIQKQMSDIVLSLREEDYLDLPPVRFLTHKVQLTDTAMRTYRRMARQFKAEVGGVKLTAANAGVLDGKLLQLANGVVYTGEGRETVEVHEAKVEFLTEFVAAATGKLLIAYYYLPDLERIIRVLERSGRRWARLVDDREFEDWSRGAYEVGVLHPASAGHGLNDVYKAGAEDLLHYGMTANLGLYQQVNGRLTGGHRRQGRHVKIHHIVAEGTRDEDYVDILQNKAATQDDLARSLATRLPTI